MALVFGYASSLPATSELRTTFFFPFFTAAVRHGREGWMRIFIEPDTAFPRQSISIDHLLSLHSFLSPHHGLAVRSSALELRDRRTHAGMALVSAPILTRFLHFPCCIFDVFPLLPQILHPPPPRPLLLLLSFFLFCRCFLSSVFCISRPLCPFPLVGRLRYLPFLPRSLATLREMSTIDLLPSALSQFAVFFEFPFLSKSVCIQTQATHGDFNCFMRSCAMPPLLCDLFANSFYVLAFFDLTVRARGGR